MALQDQIVSIPLGRGIDSKTDPKLVPTEKLLLLQDARVGDANIKKRFGYNELSVTTTQTTGTGTTSSKGVLTQGSALGSFNDELLFFDNNKVYSYSETKDEFIDKGINVSVGVGRQIIQRNNNNLKYADSAIYENILFTIYYDTVDADYRITVIDNENGASFLNDVTVESSSGSKGYCKAIYLQGSFYGFYVDGNDLKYVKVDLSDLSKFIAATTLVSGTANPVFDLIPLSSSQAFLSYNDTSNQTIIGIFTASTATLATQTIAKDSPHGTLCVLDSFNSNVFVFFSGTNSGLGRIEYAVYDFSLSQVLAPTILETIVGAKVYRMAGYVTSSGNCEVLYEVDSTTAVSDSTQVNTTNDTINFGDALYYTGTKVTFTAATTAPTGLTSGNPYYLINSGSGNYQFASTLADALNGAHINITAAGSGDFTVTKTDTKPTNYIGLDVASSSGSVNHVGNVLFGVSLASKAEIFQDEIGVCVEWQSDLQPTTFLVLVTPNGLPYTTIVAKCNVNRGKGINDTPILPSMISLDENTLAIANSEKIRIEVEDNQFTFEDGIVLNKFFTDRTQRYFNEQQGKNTIVGGGIVKSYDGYKLTELNFNIFPEDVLASELSSGGSLSAGIYGFQVVYRWIDNQGIIHRSAPSTNVSVTCSGGSSTVNLKAPGLTLTDKRAAFGTTEVIIELYMTAVNGSIYYLKDTATNDTTSLYIDFSVTTEPTGSEELLYTTGGILENLPPPPSNLVKATKNRLFVVNAENEKSFYYSKIAQNQFGISFNDILQNQIQEGVNKISAMEAMDDKVVFFSKSKIHFISGDGPNDLGFSNTFTEPQLVTNQVGSSNPDSTVYYAEGVIFQSQDKGYWLLGRGLDVSYIGADVEGYKDLTIVSANHIENKNEIRLSSSDGTQLVYDYFKKQWAIDTGLPSNDAVYQNNSFWLLRNENGILWKEMVGSYVDNSGPIRMVEETPWIKLANLQGFQRVKRMAVLGKFKSDHKLKIQIAYDYEEFYREELNWDAGTIIGTSLFGDDATFGDDSVFGGVDDGVYQFRLHLPRQKCQAIKFRFEDVSESSPGESMELTAIDLSVGVKKGINKLRADKSI